MVFPSTARIQPKLKSELFFSLLFYSSCVPSLPMVKPSLAYLDYTHPLSIYHGFSSDGIMSCVHVGPTLELKLIHSAPDTWHTVSHSKCAKCLALRSLPRKTCKFRLSRYLTKFDVVTRFRETIPTVKSVL